MNNTFKIETWYAEHESEGEKFYKVMKISGPMPADRFAVCQYGPRAVFVSMDSMSTGSVAVDQALTATAGNQKLATKRRGGYRKGERTESRSFASKSELERFIRTNFGDRTARDSLTLVRQMQEVSTPDPAGSTPEDTTDVAPSMLSNHKDFGSW